MAINAHNYIDFSAAIAAANAEAADLYIPAGEYVFSPEPGASAIRVTSAIRVFGDGAATRLVLSPEHQDSCTLLMAAAPDGMVTFEALQLVGPAVRGNNQFGISKEPAGGGVIIRGVFCNSGIFDPVIAGGNGTAKIIVEDCVISSPRNIITVTPNEGENPILEMRRCDFGVFPAGDITKAEIGYIKPNVNTIFEDCIFRSGYSWPMIQHTGSPQTPGQYTIYRRCQFFGGAGAYPIYTDLNSGPLTIDECEFRCTEALRAQVTTIARRCTWEGGGILQAGTNLPLITVDECTLTSAAISAEQGGGGIVARDCTLNDGARLFVIGGTLELIGARRSGNVVVSMR